MLRGIEVSATTFLPLPSIKLIAAGFLSTAHIARKGDQPYVELINDDVGKSVSSNGDHVHPKGVFSVKRTP